MEASFTDRKRIRKSFSRLTEIIDLPNLIEVQKNSYANFLQAGTPRDQRKNSGLQEVLKSIFPIKDYNNTASVDFCYYDLEAPKFEVDECRQKSLNYTSQLKVSLQLITWDPDEATGAGSIRDIKEQEVYIGDIPLMTENGTFIINGTERVVVSQMQRAPGVFFDHDRGRGHSSGKLLFSARIIPYRGSWLDFEFDAKDFLYVRIDRRRKFLVTTMLRALDDAATEARRIAGEEIKYENAEGMSAEEILSTFYESFTYMAKKGAWLREIDETGLLNHRLEHDLINAANDKVVFAKGSKVTRHHLKKLTDLGATHFKVPEENIYGQYLAKTIIAPSTGEVLAEPGAEIDSRVLSTFAAYDIKEFSVLAIDNINIGSYLRDTLMADKTRSRLDALADIYKVMRPGDPPNPEAADKIFRGLFFNLDRYSLSAVGRVKLNDRLGFTGDDMLDVDDERNHVLRKADLLAVVRTLIDLRDGKGQVDDIDSLANRRVRSVGELLENQFRVGLLRVERAVKERMSSVEIERMMPQDIINAKPLVAAVQKFFSSSQLSQFMDQTNPLSEITNKRRLSALGVGGLTRERAGFEVRDVHPTHYGRICPIETPEGPNIGLINSLATFARINCYGFIETPYRPVVDGKISDEVVYMSAIDERGKTIAEASVPLDADGRLANDFIPCRQAGEYAVVARDEVEYVDLSPKQLVSVVAALIPFLENDDANRALMGSNMQRQAMPLLKPQAPLVGTGMERIVARDSGAVISAKRTGIVDQVDGKRIVVRSTEEIDNSRSGVDIYRLKKFQRSNQNTCINQRPLVKVGDHIKGGDIIADGPSTNLGELALGRNILVAFMPWNGYNFEDSILVSERVVQDDHFTSVHIEEFEIMARDTKLGEEEITREIPNVSEERLRHLDETGVITVGARVGSGDILVGKVTPKGESPTTPEEKLLRAIFGEKAIDVRDTSLKMPPGAEGTVLEVRIFSRRGVEKDERALIIEQEEIKHLIKDRDDEKNILTDSYRERFKQYVLGREVMRGPKKVADGKVTEAQLEATTLHDWRQIVMKDSGVNDVLETLFNHYQDSVAKVERRFEDKVDKLQAGSDLMPGVMKSVKVFVAIKRRLQPGDKMAGRHGNKGVISRTQPIEDMPYLHNGEPVDIVLNPLGVPSRMNLGQILETHLGWACAELGHQIAEAAEVFRREGQREALVEKIQNAYDDQGVSALVADYDDTELLELSDNLAEGVPVATPVFDGARGEDIHAMLARAGLPQNGQTRLIDGRTGEPFDREVTVGYIYMLKLHHLVDEKMHARSTGPYSLVTQQPLGGKAQFGGQRFGEMEVWALQAYGAAHTLQEILTVKSDDVAGRNKVYETLVRGEENFSSGLPESFNVLVKELSALGLNLEMISRE
ncbi:MAG: DNA-directed RNA polymerase subunit beta [Alphaproteobacteria bacterium]|nr:DNA-directed RNA polymerase subunit beta [Alphaproteobacteria bacterium]